MTVQTHQQLAAFIWNICNLLRGPYKRNEYRKVILPLTVLRRFDCILAPTKDAVLKEHAALQFLHQIVRGDARYRCSRGCCTETVTSWSWRIPGTTIP